jgi:II/X family phage/plasmid replication protein
MLIDWLTCRVDTNYLSEKAVNHLKLMGDRIVRFDPKTGEMKYETQAWDSVRSDSHNVTIRFGSDAFWIQGSPARVIGNGCAVFGSGASSKLDIYGCITSMVGFVAKQEGIELPEVGRWKISRIDVTDNIAFESEEKVLEALNIFTRTDGGRYKVSNKSGDSVYWNSKSRIRKGKAYAKGQHLAYLMKKKGYEGIRYSISQLESAKKLLRLELTLGAQFLRENIRHWFDLTSEDLALEHKKYFDRMIGDASVSNMNELKERLIKVCPTELKASAAFKFYGFIQSQGLDSAKREYGRSMFYVHKANLKKAGLGDSDISIGEIVSLRRNVLDMKSVISWDDLKVA